MKVFNECFIFILFLKFDRNLITFLFLEEMLAWNKNFAQFTE